MPRGATGRAPKQNEKRVQILINGAEIQRVQRAAQLPSSLFSVGRGLGRTQQGRKLPRIAQGLAGSAVKPGVVQEQPCLAKALAEFLRLGARIAQEQGGLRVQGEDGFRCARPAAIASRPRRRTTRQRSQFAIAHAEGSSWQSAA